MLKSKCKSLKTALLSLGTLWILCFVSGLIGFKLRWDQWPDFGVVLFGFLTFPLALPISFSHTIGLLASNNPRLHPFLMLLFWMVMGGVHYLFIRYRHWSWLVPLAALAVAASKEWHIVAAGLMGL